MGYSIQFESKPNYFYCFVSGQESYETSLEIWRRIGQKVAEIRCENLLVEEDLEGQLSDIEMYELTSRFGDMGLRGVRIAFVDRHMDHEQGNRLGELVATNRGLSGRVFGTLQEAEEWLTAGETGRSQRDTND